MREGMLPTLESEDGETIASSAWDHWRWWGHALAYVASLFFRSSCPGLYLPQEGPLPLPSSLTQDPVLPSSLAGDWRPLIPACMKSCPIRVLAWLVFSGPEVTVSPPLLHSYLLSLALAARVPTRTNFWPWYFSLLAQVALGPGHPRMCESQGQCSWHSHGVPYTQTVLIHSVHGVHTCLSHTTRGPLWAGRAQKDAAPTVRLY